MSEQSTNQSQRVVYLVDGARTPFLKMRGQPGPFKASDLAVYAGRDLIHRYSFAPSAIDQVVVGCVGPAADEANIGRIIGLRMGCGDKVPGWTVQRNCASGLQALDCGFRAIQSGQSELVVAGGTEAMSHAPLLFKDAMVKWLAGLAKSKTAGAKFGQLLKLRPQYLGPVISLLKALTDPVVNLSMGQTAEEIAYRFGITRAEMDTFAQQSHLKAARAQEAGCFKEEIVPVYGRDGTAYEKDDGIRADSNFDKLSKLRPVFDKKGNITAGNSSQVTDGAAMLLLASEAAVAKYNLPVMAKIIDVQWSALDPKVMGLGPVHAITDMLKRQGLTLNDIGVCEINEAFAAQVLGCLRAWEDEDYLKEDLGLTQDFGKLDPSILNIDGGAIAQGHPVGASGARLALHLSALLKRQNSRYGVASLCIGGGQGGAMLVENVERAA